MTLRHVLFDADGVLQHIPDGWYAAVARYLGDRRCLLYTSPSPRDS